MTDSKETRIYSPKKLIEVALPLDDINVAAAREKSIRHGHPSTLHLWWARRPLAAARAVIFAQMVNDPGYQQDGGFKYGVNKKEAEIKREKLFQIIRDLVKWENTNNEEVLNRAREAIRESWRETCHLNRNHPQAAALFNPEKLPAFHDPFAGGGAIPLEAQRLGLESYASDLNPVAVMINKAMIEIPPKFAGQTPVGPIPELEAKGKDSVRPSKQLDEDWSGAKGLAEDVRRYGHWMREEAFKRIGHLYPKVKITDEMVAERPDLKRYAGEELTVIAWLWARTVKSPNPAFNEISVPLISNYYLSSKPGKESYINIEIEPKGYRFRVVNQKPVNVKEMKKGNKLLGRAKFQCVMSGTTIDSTYIKKQGVVGGISQRLMSLVIVSQDGNRYFLSGDEVDATTGDTEPTWSPKFEFARNSRHMTPYSYGLDSFDKFFTKRQTTCISTFSDLVPVVYDKMVKESDGNSEYARAIATYLAFSISKGIDYWNNLCTWRERGSIDHLFSRHAIPMVWDFAEANPLVDMHCSWDKCVDWVSKSITSLNSDGPQGSVLQEDAAEQKISIDKVVSTDPPYYDNVPYADLSDFFLHMVEKSIETTMAR